MKTLYITKFGLMDLERTGRGQVTALPPGEGVVSHAYMRVEEAAEAVRSVAVPAAAPEKRAPVQGYTPGIPWSLHLEAYDAYSKKWAPQPAMIDLEGRNCRGGFSAGELDMFIPGWRDRVSEIGQLKARVAELEAQLAQRQPPEAA